MRKPSTKKTTKAKPKYPYLGCYVDVPFNWRYTRQFLDANITLDHYKGAMLLRVLSTDTERQAAAKTLELGPLAGTAWMRGDDLDALIAMLREAKQVWLRAYRQAKRARPPAKKGRK